MEDLKKAPEKRRISTMRFMSLVSLGAGIILAGVGLWMRVDLTELSLLVGVFVGAAFSGKAAQKFAERKRAPDEFKGPIGE